MNTIDQKYFDMLRDSILEKFSKKLCKRWEGFPLEQIIQTSIKMPLIFLQVRHPDIFLEVLKNMYEDSK